MRNSWPYFNSYRRKIILNSLGHLTGKMSYNNDNNVTRKRKRNTFLTTIKKNYSEEQQNKKH